MNIAVITTFPNNMFDVYAKKMLQSFTANWPKEVPLLVQLDDDLLLDQVKAHTRQQDAIAVGWEEDHKAFVERNKDKDHPTDYRKQAVRFCHKIFAIKRAMDSVQDAKNDGLEHPRYLIWMDADVITTKPVTLDMLKECLPIEEDAVAFLGRKDWDHSECGWLAFDLEQEGIVLINEVFNIYKSNQVYNLQQWHDSWVWDCAILKPTAFIPKSTNLTEGKPGMDIWPHSPMGKWSTHYKGPQAKQKLFQEKPMANKTSNISIQTINAIPNEEIRAHIAKNQEIIKNWIQPCTPHDEEIVFVSAGPTLIAEDVRKEVEAGRKIIAVKHALTPLKKAGVKPWGAILLDPRPHVADFVQDADPEIIWFVASQVNPLVTLQLLAKGCTVWGYHANVNAGEEELIAKQKQAIVGGGSATATRGLFVMAHLGFKNMRLYGYDLCVPDKPDMEAKDERGQAKYFEISIGMNDPLYNVKKLFWSEPQFIAQYEDINELMKQKKFNIEAFGDGIVPFMLKAQKTADMRRSEMQAKIAGPNPPNYQELLRLA